MGFIEETGAAQHLRDARIAPIYEGTNGIQAADLVGRKLGLDGGAALDGLIADIRAEAQHAGSDRAGRRGRRCVVATARAVPSRTTGWRGAIRS